MKILVTGSTGFIGNHVIEELIKYKDHKIIATSRNQEKAKKFDWNINVKYISCDLNIPIDNYFSFFEEPDILIHLVWEGLPNFKELYHFERNVMVNYNFIKNMVKNGLTNISVIGTCFEYGMHDGCLSEDMPTQPVTAYGLAKDTLRKYIEQFRRIPNDSRW